MIKHLDAVAFGQYGSVFPENAPRNLWVNSVSISLSPRDISGYQATGDTNLCFEAGSSVLSVSLDGSAYEDFYLDRPVKLTAGVYFRLAGFQGKSTVQLSAISMPREVETLAAESFLTYPQVGISHLCAVFYQEREKGFIFPGEAHPDYEIIFVDQGSLHCVADGKDLLLQQGDLTLYGKDQFHMQYADMDVAPRFVSIRFAADTWDLNALQCRIFKTTGKTKGILQQILWEQENKKTHSSEMILYLLNILLIGLEREQYSPSERSQTLYCANNENEIIRKAQEFISSNIRKKLSVPVIAQNIQVSASYLTALFHKHLQISPGEYLRRVKLQESKQMIRDGNMNLTEIAAALQYSTIHHFSRQFKEKFGITPSEYAKSIR